jgi:hypothetical protein
MIKVPDNLKPLETEILIYMRELPRLLAEGHEGRHVLIKGDEVLSLWDTHEEAYEAGRMKFGWGVVFLAQPIEERALHFPWPQDEGSRKAI